MFNYMYNIVGCGCGRAAELVRWFLARSPAEPNSQHAKQWPSGPAAHDEWPVAHTAGGSKLLW
jgi:hypothetical protein